MLSLLSVFLEPAALGGLPAPALQHRVDGRHADTELLGQVVQATTLGAQPVNLQSLLLVQFRRRYILAFVALRALGKQYSGYVTLQEDHQLVQTGIYGVIRHPIYLRALMVFVGLPLIFRSWLLLPLFVVGVLFVGYRIRQEEKLLAEHFGAEFEAYRRRTWRLLPYLY